MVGPKSRLKGDFLNKKATKKPTKFSWKQTKKSRLSHQKTDYFYHPYLLISIYILMKLFMHNSW